MEPHNRGRCATPEAALCVGKDRLLVVNIKIGEGLYSAIIDTGATCSYLPLNGRVMKEVNPKTYKVNVKSRLASDSYTERNDKETKCHIKLEAHQEMKSLEATFLIISNQDSILDHDVLLGYPEILALGLVIEPKDGQLCVVHGNDVIGRDCEAKAPIRALVAVQNKSKASKELEILVRCYKKVFAEKAESTINCKPVRVFLTKCQPLKAKPMRFSPENMNHLKTLLDRWLKDKIIEKSNSPYSCSAHFVPKKSGAPRLVNNYIPINKRVIWDNYPLPTMTDMMAALQGTKFFSALDLTEGFLQVPLHREDRHKLAFVTPLGMFQFTRLPYGYINSPSAFQRVMNEVFWEGLYKKCIVYIDDILVFGKTESEHHENLEWVLLQCQKNNVKLNAKKCKFFCKEVEFLGYRITDGTISAFPNKFQDVFEKTPQSKEELATVLGKLGFYSRFIKDFSQLTLPLRRLARKEAEFKWSEEHNRCLKQLKKNLDAATPQVLPDESTKKFANIMVREYDIEVALSTVDDQLIGRASQILSETESRYTPVEKALLAMIMTYKNFRHCLTTSNLTFRSGIKALKNAIRLVDMPARVERLLLRLPPEVNPEIEYCDELAVSTENPSSNKQLKKVRFENQKPEEIDHDEFEAVYYTDGACQGNGTAEGRASWAYVPTDPKERCRSGLISNEPPTNQVAELKAATEAILQAKRNGKRSVLIYTDSDYTAQAINGRLDGWKNNNWMACNRKTVINKKALQDLCEAIGDLRVAAIRLPAHSGIPGNEKADQLARKELVGLLTVEDEDIDQEISAIVEQMEENDDLREKYVFKDRKLFMRVKNSQNQEILKLYVPKSQRGILLYFAHDNDTFGGHMGVKKTLKKLANFVWPQMQQHVTNYVKTCDLCQRFREEKGLKRGFMHVLPVQKAFQTVYMDLITPIHETYTANKVIITLIDGYTRYGIAKACPRVLSEHLVDFVKDEVLLRHGLVERIVCDNGPVFRSQMFQDAMKKLGIEISFTCPYNPQANGRVERWNGTLKAILKKYTDKAQFEWDKHVQKAVYSYNITKHESTKYSPYELLYGRTNRSPLNIQDSEEYHFEDFDPHRILARQQALENMNQSAITAKYYYDKKHQPIDFHEDQEILVRLKTLPLRISRKLAHKWIGPFKLVKIIGPKDNPSSVIFRDDRSNLHRAAFSNIKPYHRRDDLEAKELENIVSKYEQQGIPVLLRDLNGDQERETDQDSTAPGDEGLDPESQNSSRNQNPSDDITHVIDELYEPRPTPTQQLIAGQELRRFGPNPVIRDTCRPTILRRPVEREIQPIITPIDVLGSTPSQPVVSADYDPMDMFGSLEPEETYVLASEPSPQDTQLERADMGDENAPNESRETIRAQESESVADNASGQERPRSASEGHQLTMRRSTRIPKPKKITNL